MPFDVAVVGSFNVDTTCIVDNLPAKGETKLGTSYSTACGGKGTNQCVQAARLGAKATLICKIGADSLGDELYKLCLREDISQAGIIQDHGASTAIAQITVDSEGENSIVVIPGANYKLNIEDIQKFEQIIKESKVLLCQNEIMEDVSIEALKIARRHGTFTVMNAAPAKFDFNPEIFSLSDIFIVNCLEASQITKTEVISRDGAENAAKILIQKGCKAVIITMGKDGLIYSSENEQLYTPTTKVQVFDSTGAGDCFVGSLGYFLSTSPTTEMAEILKKCSYIAAVSVRKVGAQGGMPRRADLSSLFS